MATAFDELKTACEPVEQQGLNKVFKLLMDALARARRIFEIMDHHGLINQEEFSVQLGKRQRVSE